MKVRARRDFDVGNQSLKQGQEADLNGQDARGLIDIGFVEQVTAPSVEQPPSSPATPQPTSSDADQQ